MLRAFAWNPWQSDPSRQGLLDVRSNVTRSHECGFLDSLRPLGMMGLARSAKEVAGRYGVHAIDSLVMNMMTAGSSQPTSVIVVRVR